MIASLTSGAISKHETAFGDKFSAALTSSLQIFADFISLKEKQMECIWMITYLEEDVLVVFPTGFDKRHDSESDKIVSPHWVVVVSPLKYTWRQQVENLMNTHWRIESVLSLTWFFFERKYLTTNEEELFLLFSVTSKHNRQKIFSITSAGEPHQRLSMVRKSRSA